MTDTVTLPSPPSANRYWRRVGNRTLLSEAAREYRHLARLCALAAGMRPLDGPVVLTVAWYRARRVGDLTNRLKILEDALQGAAFADDSQVVEVHAYRHEDKADPRVVVTVRPFAGAPAAPERT